MTCTPTTTYNRYITYLSFIVIVFHIEKSNTGTLVFIKDVAKFKAATLVLEEKKLISSVFLSLVKRKKERKKINRKNKENAFKWYTRLPKISLIFFSNFIIFDPEKK